MAAHLTEEEQIEALKRWWKENGKGTVAIIAIMLAGFFGWNQYKSQQEAKSNEGSKIFEKLVAITTAVDTEASPEQETSIQAIADELAKHDNSSLYSDFARLYLAKMAITSGKLDSAVATLEQVVQSSADASIKELANLRLARLLGSKGDPERALSILSNNVSVAYKAAYAETKGDILLADKRLVEAHKAYQLALQSMGVEQMMRRNLVQLKIDHTSVAPETTTDVSLPSQSDTNTADKAGDA